VFIQLVEHEMDDKGERTFCLLWN